MFEMMLIAQATITPVKTERVMICDKLFGLITTSCRYETREIKPPQETDKEKQQRINRENMRNNCHRSYFRRICEK